MFTIDKQTVLGTLKATGSQDPDVLYNAKTQLVQMSKGMRGYSWIPMICGVLLTVTVIGAFVGIPAFLVGPSTITMFRPSRSGWDSIWPISLTSSASRSKRSRPRSG